MNNPNIVTDQKCCGCAHYRRLRSGGDSLTGSYACHYCFDTGHSRGCSIEECGKKIPDDGRKHRKSVDLPKKRA